MHINYSTSSGLKASSAVITAMTSTLMGVDVTPPTSGYTIFTIYDSNNSSTSGKNIIAQVYVDAGTTGVNHEFFAPVLLSQGIYAELAGTGTDSQYIVRFALG